MHDWTCSDADIWIDRGHCWEAAKEYYTCRQRNEKCSVYLHIILGFNGLVCVCVPN